MEKSKRKAYCEGTASLKNILRLFIRITVTLKTHPRMRESLMRGRMPAGCATKKLPVVRAIKAVWQYRRRNGGRRNCQTKHRTERTATKTAAWTSSPSKTKLIQKGVCSVARQQADAVAHLQELRPPSECVERLFSRRAQASVMKQC